MPLLPTSRHERVWIAVLSTLLMGCESSWQGEWVQHAPVQRVEPQRPAQVTVGQQTRQPVPIEEDDDSNVNMARADVLAFIERLEKAEQGSPTDSDADRNMASSSVDRSADHRDGYEPRIRRQSSVETPRANVNRIDQPRATEPMRVSRPGVERDRARAMASGRVGDAVRPRVVRVWISGSESPSFAEAVPAQFTGGVESAAFANMPVQTGSEPVDEKRDIDALIAELETHVEENPEDEEARWRLALVRLAFGKSDCSAGKELSPEVKSESLLKKSICTLAATKRAVDDPVTSVDEALGAVDELRTELRDRAVLSVPAIALCSSVRAFGVYEELPEGHFRPYARNQAIAYFEVGHFLSEPTADGRFRTLLSDRFEIMTREGEVVWSHNEPQIEDISRRQREDFFVAQRIAIPPILQEGQYVLKVTVEDQLAGKRTQAMHTFTVSGSLASTQQ